MIQTCAAYCKEFGLAFNAKKSSVVVFSKNNVDYDNLGSIFLNGAKVEYTDKYTYLGTTIVSKKGLAFSSCNDLAKFYLATNSILRAASKPSEEVLSHLLYTCCVPILSYASAVKEYSSRQMQDCTTAINDAFRFIFGYNRWESVRTLRESLGYKSLIDIFHKSKRKFDASLLSHQNPVITHIARNVIVEPE